MPSLTLTEAQERAVLISGLSSRIHLDLTGTEDFGCTAQIGFSCSRLGAETFLELTGAEDLTVRLNGVELEPAAYDGERIRLRDLAEHNRVEVSARLPYVTDGDGLHTMTDPADGERYVCGYTAMDVARKVIPCFDQPDLKTTFELSVTAPAHWTVLANGVSTQGDDPAPLSREDAREWRFAPTPPISSYLFFVTGGPYASVTWEEPFADGTLRFGWHARASLAVELERDADELREITSRCFAHYGRIFEPAYPFADYQQVFTPGLNWGAMEFPGCVAFRDELLFRGTSTAMQRNGRASVIAHEMAHMWFGDLVTMRWWEDTWLNESFADFMGYEVAGTAAGYADSWTAAALRRKPTAYQADRRRSTHPIAADAEDVADVDTAFGNFDMITYAKGNAVLRQLVTWLGEEDFLAGVNRHLSAHRFGNATLADFLDALDSGTDRDVRGWAESWLRTTGFDTIRVSREGDVPVLTREGTRPHRFTVTAYDESLGVVGSRPVDLAAEPVRLEEYAGLVVVPNSGDETYAAITLDAGSWEAVRSGLGRIADPLTRAMLWSATALRVEHGEMAVTELVSLAEQLAAEEHPVVFEGAMDHVLTLLRRCAAPHEVAGLLPPVAAVADSVLRVGDERAPAAARALASVAADPELLGRWLDGGGELPVPDQDIRWLICRRLAELGDGSRLDAEAARDRSAAGELGLMRARAALPTPEAKAAAWSRLMSGELSNREFDAVGAGFWGWEQADLVAPYLRAYVQDGLELARESGQAFGKVIGGAFPWLPLTAGQRLELREALAGALAGDVPTVLARTWNDRLDDLDLVIAARPSS